MMTPMRVALVGAGLAANSHGLDIATADDLDLAGALGTSHASARALTDVFGGVVYPDLDAVLGDPRVDAVVVAVPPHSVLGILERVAATGKPCLVEKPIATGNDDLSLLRHVLEANSPVAAPFNRRYQPHILGASHEVSSGTIGDVVGVTAVWNGPYRSRFEPGSGTYRSSAGPRQGVLLDSGTHALDTVLLLLAAVDKPVTSRAVLRRNERGAEIEADLVFSLGPVEVALQVNDADQDAGCDRCAWRVTVQGTTGVITVDDGGLRITSLAGRELGHTAPQESQRPVSDLGRLRDRVTPLGTGPEGILALSELLIQAYDAQHTKPTPWLRPRGKALGRLNGAC